MRSTDATPIYTYDEAWDSVMATIHTDAAIAADMRELIVTLLEHARERYRPTVQRPNLPPENDDNSKPS